MINLHPGCPYCTREQIGKDRLMCTKCEAEQNPSPLRQWRDLFGTTLDELVEETGLAKRTIVRADQGERMSQEAAIILARRTGLHWSKFRPKDDDGEQV